MRRPNLLVFFLVAVGLPLLTAADPAAAAKRPVQLVGGEQGSGAFCGPTRAYVRVPNGEGLRATVAPAKSSPGRRSRRGTRLSIEKCQDGAYTKVSSSVVGGTRKRRNKNITTSREATGDYRVHMVSRTGGNKGASVWVRVGAGEIVDTPVSFTVKNENRTPIACATGPDGGTYTVRGRLIAPRTSLTGSGSSGRGPDMAFYYHGVGYAQFFWHFTAVPGYDYVTEQARDGHASLFLDRLGMGESDGPASGNQDCAAAESDVADQVIQKMRRGDYTTGEGPGPSAGRVALVGHSAGSIMALGTQGVFHSADALALLGYNTVVPSPLAVSQLGQSTLQCVAAPDSGPGGRTDYADFGATDADFVRGHFFDVDPRVATATLKLRTREPCGQVNSFTFSLVANQQYARTLDVPTLYLSGQEDAFFDGDQLAVEATYNPANADKTTFVPLPGSGHALTLGRTRDAFRSQMDRWLTANGF